MTDRGRYVDRPVLRPEWRQSGFPNRTSTTITFVNGTRIFTLAPTATSFSYYLGGQEHIKTGSQTITITDTDGQHWIYFTTTSGNLQEILNPTVAQVEDLILNQCLVAMVYWDANSNEGWLLDERHGIEMSPATHVLLHECVGTLYSWGIALTSLLVDQTGNLDTHAQFGNSQGEVYDEDNRHVIDAIASNVGYVCFWWDGTRWVQDTNAGFPILTTGTGRMAWNNYGAGTLVEVTNNQFALTHLFATSAANGDPVVVVGQGDYATLTLARAGADVEISNLILAGLPSPEMKPIATVIYQTNNGYLNAVKSRTRSTGGGHDYVDWRMNPISPGGGTVLDHGASGGLGDDDHLIYLLLAGRSGGQVAYGGTAAGDDLTLRSTSNVAKGSVFIADDGGETVVGAAAAATTPSGATATIFDVDGPLYSTVANYEKAKVYNAGNQSINDSTTVRLSWDSEDFDWGALHDVALNTSRLTATIAGKYLIGGQVRWDDSGDAAPNGSRWVAVELNRLSYLLQSWVCPVPVSDTNDTVQTVVVLATLALNDYVELSVWQNSGGAVNVLGGMPQSNFWMVRVG